MKRAPKTIARALGAAIIATALVAVVAGPASADTPRQTVNWTKIGIYPRTGPSWSSARAGAAVPDGTVVTVLCEVDGEAVTSDVAANDTVWADTNIGWLPNAFLDSGYDGRTPGVADCNAQSAPAPVAPAAPPAAGPSVAAPPATSAAPSSGTPADAQAAPSAPHLTSAGSYGIQWTDAQIASTSSYNRAAVARWALANFKTWTGKYDFGDNNCTYFTSTMLTDVAGWGHDWTWSDWSLVVNASSVKNIAYWFGPTKAYVGADPFKNWLRNSGYIDQVEDVTGDATLPGRAQVGDIIQYDQHDAKNNPGADGTVDHTMVIVGFNNAGQALVVGVSPAPTGPNPWNWGTGTNPVSAHAPGSRIYLLHITR
ncbi:MAG TPA: amidase domain-containing protein [Pseudolysinimonas sp.]|jgi:hypothetical protein